MKRAASLILALALVLTLFPATAQAASPAYGSEVWLRDTALQEGVTLSENIFWSSGYDKPRHEYYITYTLLRHGPPQHRDRGRSPPAGRAPCGHR